MSTEIKVYWSNNQLWHIIDNADGTISAYYNANCKPCNRVPYKNVATAVKSAGGLDAFKARLITPEEAEARLAALAAEKAERAASTRGAFATGRGRKGRGNNPDTSQYPRSPFMCAK